MNLADAILFEEYGKFANRADQVRLEWDNAKRSLLGSHGIKGWSDWYKHPIESTWKGFNQMGGLGKGLTAYSVYSSLQSPGGPFERAGSALGTLAPLGMYTLGKKGPGLLGTMAVSDALGGGLLVRDGIFRRAGRKLDSMFGTNKQPEVGGPA